MKPTSLPLVRILNLMGGLKKRTFNDWKEEAERCKVCRKRGKEHPARGSAGEGRLVIA